MNIRNSRFGVALVALGMAVSVTSAMAAPHDRDDTTRRIPNPGNDLVTRFIGQNFYGDSILRVRQELNLGPQHRGRRIEYVSVTVQALNRFADAQLIIDRATVGAGQSIDRFRRELRFYPDRFNDTLGDEAQAIQIRFRGDVSVGELSIQFAPEHGMGRDYVEIPVNRTYRSTTLPLRQLLDLDSRYRGMEVEYVMLNASTNRGNGQAQLILDGMGVGSAQAVGIYTQPYYFYTTGVRNRLDVDLFTMDLALRGNFTVTSIAVKFRGGNHGPGPGPGPRPVPVPHPVPQPGPSVVSAVVNQDFDRGVNRLQLDQYIRLGFGYETRSVTMVTVRARSARGRGVVQFLVTGSPVGPAATVGIALDDHTFAVPARIQGRDLSELVLEFQGNIYVESVTVAFSDRR